MELLFDLCKRTVGLIKSVALLPRCRVITVIKGIGISDQQ